MLLVVIASKCMTVLSDRKTKRNTAILNLQSTAPFCNPRCVVERLKS